MKEITAKLLKHDFINVKKIKKLFLILIRKWHQYGKDKDI